MLRDAFRRITGLIAIAIAAALLASCASDPRYKEGLSWIVYNEQQKADLNARGFPQYSWP